MINAKIIADSICSGIRIITFELEYPRFIHSELMTHRMFSRNAASSRAIPIATMNKNIADKPGIPEHWGKNKSGMQADGEVDEKTVEEAIELWHLAKTDAIMSSTAMANLGIHKQIANRLTEPFQHMKVIVTATEYDNWYALRNHPDAQPEIQILARCMRIEQELSTPKILKSGQWHLPYINSTTDSADQVSYDGMDLQTAKMVSVSACAQVSYRKTDTSVEKAKEIYDRLIGMKPFHASPFEHQATPMGISKFFGATTFEKGTTHLDRNGNYWSNNFMGWTQNRALLEV